MGAKQGGKMEKVQRKEMQSSNNDNQRVSVKAAHDQTVKCEEDGEENEAEIDIDDDDDQNDVEDQE